MSNIVSRRGLNPWPSYICLVKHSNHWVMSLIYNSHNISAGQYSDEIETRPFNHLISKRIGECSALHFRNSFWFSVPFRNISSYSRKSNQLRFKSDANKIPLLILQEPDCPDERKEGKRLVYDLARGVSDHPSHSLGDGRRCTRFP